MRFLAFLCLATALPAPAFATTVRPLTLAARHELSELVILAEVQAIEARREGGPARVVSEITLKPIASFKGEPEGPIRLRRAGGEIDGLRTWADGLYDYQVGERVLVFLVPYRGNWVSVGVGIGTLPARQRAGGHQVWFRGAWRGLHAASYATWMKTGGARAPVDAPAPLGAPTSTPAPGR